MLKITAIERPFILKFKTGQKLPLTSEETQRLIDASVVVSVNSRQVTIEHGTQIVPATLGGGPAFIIERRTK